MAANARTTRRPIIRPKKEREQVMTDGFLEIDMFKHWIKSRKVIRT